MPTSKVHRAFSPDKHLFKIFLPSDLIKMSTEAKSIRNQLRASSTSLHSMHASPTGATGVVASLRTSGARTALDSSARRDSVGASTSMGVDAMGESGMVQAASKFDKMVHDYLNYAYDV